MTILHVVRCEQYEDCKQQFPIAESLHGYIETPKDWLTLADGNPRETEAKHFCSKACLRKWLVDGGE